MKLCGFETGNRNPFFLIAGPCVIESREMVMEIASFMKETCDELGIRYIFKASFDKANRTSTKSYRGPGIDEGLKILDDVRREVSVPVLTDVHTPEQVRQVADVVDVLQTPAFLCRQTDFIVACAKSGKPVNIKKGQFLAPHDMVNVIAKAREAALEEGLNPDNFMVCERGTTFGYGNLVSDMRSLAIMRETKAPVVLTPRIRCRCRAAAERVPAAIAASCPCFHVLRLLLEWTGFSLRLTPIRIRLFLTDPIWFRSIVCRICSKSLCASTALSKGSTTSKTVFKRLPGEATCRVFYDSFITLGKNNERHH